MPPPLFTQTVIACIWDFDKTLIPGYMQDPLFAEYDVDPKVFWAEVNGLVGHYAERGLLVSKDTAYLGHILSYVTAGRFPDLTNEHLRELGQRLTLAPGMPDFMLRSRARVAQDDRYRHHGVTVEHYILSTGLRQIILGTDFGPVVDGIWGSELLPDPPGPGYLMSNPAADALTGVVAQVGYTIDNTTKTRAIFEINKGANHDPALDVNALLAQEERRVPFKNMMHVADGPSDVPVFSLLNQYGGKTLGVWGINNYGEVKSLESQGRIQSMAKADYREGEAADLWIMSTIAALADEIVADRERAMAAVPGAPGHVV